ncbi:MAG: general secretion pathway protein GspG [Hyphomonas sp. BRH_c22]|uniref:type II secretion system major pseudopilin GspG n=1 Tax=Hyphomonas sp. BRH_c22 TaxID=1629710 RepID=UPI0005F17098|nr:type II secretion system major pseudopilin GspG [Hyphomonas sp. BRH_c22]KJS39845.1 MAG: general secretion pathway protein GspG [Hyphomonas sp. BRH_c22]
MTQDTDQHTGNSRPKDAGFSLVELLVTVSIMALLATAVVISVGPVLSKSRVDRARADIAALESGLEQYSFDMFNYPGADAGLGALKTPPNNDKADQYRPGGYIKRIQQDPWGNDYHYAVPGPRSGGAYDVYSAGPDGEPGNDDDIGNWN